MDRNVLIKLLQQGMRYPTGTHRIWVSRCFELTVRADQVVELDEYEGYEEERATAAPQRPRGRATPPPPMCHVGRSVIHLKPPRVIEHPGNGWGARGAHS